MNCGKLTRFAEIKEQRTIKDDEGFAVKVEVTVASVRCCREARYGSESRENLAAFSEATDLFRFRVIPGVTVTTSHYLVCDGERFDITYVDNVKGRGMYLEVLAKKVEASHG